MATEWNIIDCQTGDVIEQFQWQATAFHWRSDSEVIAACRDRTIRLYDVNTGRREILHRFSTPGAYDDALFSLDGDYVSWTNGVSSMLTAYLGDSDLSEWQRTKTCVHFHSDRWAEFSHDGHFDGSSRINRLLRYVVHTDDDRQLTMTQEEFETTYGWKNDPTRVWDKSPN